MLDDKSKEIRKKCIFLLLLTLIVFVPNVSFGKDETVCNHLDVPSDELQLHFIDVGQGDSTLVIQGDNVMLVDCGDWEESDATIQHLKKLKIQKIDVLVATHSHRDHIGGIAKILEEFKVGILYAPKEGFLARLENYVKPWHYWYQYKKYDDAIEEKSLKQGDIFSLGDADITVLSPRKKSYDSKNNYSIVLSIAYQQKRILLTGDAEYEAETEMLQSKKELQADIIKVAHHGSDTSSSEEFVKAVDPSYAIFSVGKDNPFGHPTMQTLNRFQEQGAQIERTDELGTIQFKVRKGKITQEVP